MTLHETQQAALRDDGPEDLVHAELLALRRAEVVPRIPAITGAAAQRPGGDALRVTWYAADGPLLTLAANVGDEATEVRVPGDARLLHASATLPEAAPGTALALPGWTAVWWTHGAGA